MTWDEPLRWVSRFRTTKIFECLSEFSENSNLSLLLGHDPRWSFSMKKKPYENTHATFSLKIYKEARGKTKVIIVFFLMNM
jgi:hypothetical protein